MECSRFSPSSSLSYFSNQPLSENNTTESTLKNDHQDKRDKALTEISLNIILTKIETYPIDHANLQASKECFKMKQEIKSRYPLSSYDPQAVEIWRERIKGENSKQQTSATHTKLELLELEKEAHNAHIAFLNHTLNFTKQYRYFKWLIEEEKKFFYHLALDSIDTGEKCKYEGSTQWLMLKHLINDLKIYQDQCTPPLTEQDFNEINNLLKIFEKVFILTELRINLLAHKRMCEKFFPNYDFCVNYIKKELSELKASEKLLLPAEDTIHAILVEIEAIDKEYFNFLIIDTGGVASFNHAKSEKNNEKDGSALLIPFISRNIIYEVLEIFLAVIWGFEEQIGLNKGCSKDFNTDSIEKNILIFLYSLQEEKREAKIDPPFTYKRQSRGTCTLSPFLKYKTRYLNHNNNKRFKLFEIQYHLNLLNKLSIIESIQLSENPINEKETKRNLSIPKMIDMGNQVLQKKITPK